MPLVAEVCRQEGYEPHQTNLKEVPRLEDELTRELHEIRANIVREHGGDGCKLNTYFENLRFPGFTYGIPGRTFQNEDELDEYIEERNKEFKRRKAQKATRAGVRPPKPR